MSSPSKDSEEPSSSTAAIPEEASGSVVQSASLEAQRPPAKRHLTNTVIEISDTDSDDSDVCAVNSYQASADEVKRIRGAEYSSSSSSSEYSSDSDSSWEDDSIVVDDIKVNTKPVKAQLNPRANRMDDPKFNPALKAQDVIDNLKIHWEEMKDLTNDEVTLTCDPFRVCLLNNFLENPEIINNIVDDMNTLDWSRKKMDLYEFHQTTDLANLTWQRSIRGIYELLKTEVMSWVSMVTGLELRGVSASCSLYGPGDHLLVHDDLLSDRRVAFVLYLAPWPAAPPNAIHNGSAAHTQWEEGSGGWTSRMGGALQLLARTGAGPSHVTRSVLPRNNMLALFRVGTDSYHQVDEVVSLELPRLSINGWFHGPAPGGQEPPPAPPLPLPDPLPPHTQVVVLNEWIEPTYMTPRSRAQVQAQMESQSEVCLRGLLLRGARERLLRALERPEVPWEWAGPAHQRRYERVPAAWLARAGGEGGAEAEAEAEAAAVREVAAVLGSAAFFRLLADCTDLVLTKYERLELQRWSPGSFTLLPPREQYQTARLEAVLYLQVPGRTLSGGSTTYVAPEEAEGGALVTVPPRDNALSLVYCDAGTAAFTKYLGRLAMRDHPHLYILTCTYRE